MRGPSFDIDATIDDLVENLDDPEDYVRRALDNLRAAGKKEPNSRLTIGITNYGVYPNYKIDIPLELENLDKKHIAPPKVFVGKRIRRLPILQKFAMNIGVRLPRVSSNCRRSIVILESVKNKF